MILTVNISGSKKIYENAYITENLIEFVDFGLFKYQNLEIQFQGQ